MLLIGQELSAGKSLSGDYAIFIGCDLRTASSRGQLISVCLVGCALLNISIVAAMIGSALCTFCD
ncbi:hypothetical protein ACT691_08860 [Vibrio metschnikovii]